MTRVLPFQTIDNFRDYGDYATAAGRRIAPRRLLRSAHHAKASDEDLARMAELNVATVVDLRHPQERAYQPSRRPEGFSGAVIETAVTSAQTEAPHIAFLRENDLTEESGRTYMMSAYRRIPFEPAHLDLFSRYFASLAEGEGPVLIHCAAGKDRTGILAALTHHVLGVGHDDLMEDYLLTNRVVRLEERAPEIAEMLHKHFGRRPSASAVVAFMGVAPDFLDAAFDEIAARHGSLDAYLSDLGVDQRRRDQIAERLLA